MYQCSTDPLYCLETINKVERPFEPKYPGMIEEFSSSLKNEELGIFISTDKDVNDAATQFIKDKADEGDSMMTYLTVPFGPTLCSKETEQFLTIVNHLLNKDQRFNVWRDTEGVKIKFDFGKSLPPETYNLSEIIEKADFEHVGTFLRSVCYKFEKFALSDNNL